MQTRGHAWCCNVPILGRDDCTDCVSMRFEGTDDVRALSHGKGPRAAFRERGLRGCVLDSIYEDVRNFLSTPFEKLPDQKFPGAA